MLSLRHHFICNLTESTIFRNSPKFLYALHGKRVIGFLKWATQYFASLLEIVLCYRLTWLTGQAMLLRINVFSFFRNTKEILRNWVMWMNDDEVIRHNFILLILTSMYLQAKNIIVSNDCYLWLIYIMTMIIIQSINKIENRIWISKFASIFYGFS